jgi:hypothetical protein
MIVASFGPGLSFCRRLHKQRSHRRAPPRRRRHNAVTQSLQGPKAADVDVVVVGGGKPIPGVAFFGAVLVADVLL